MKIQEKLFILFYEKHWDSDLAVVSIGLKQLITNVFYIFMTFEEDIIMSDKNLRYNEIYFSSDDKEKIKSLYLSGSSTVKIGQLFGVSHKKIARVLESLDVPRTGVGRREYKLNEYYFDEINTPNKAYVLGFLCADGSNN